MNFEQIVEAIKQKHSPDKPTLVAIDGFGGSGKSTFARKLEAALDDAYVVHIDDFFMPNVPTDEHKANFDRDRLEREVLKPIIDGKIATYQKGYFPAGDDPSEVMTVPRAQCIIVEGVSSYHPSIEKYYDFKIYLDVPTEVAQARGSSRDKSLGDNNDDLWPTWTSTYALYKEIYKPHERADTVFNTSESRIDFTFPELNDPMLSELKQQSNIDLDNTESVLERAKLIIGYAHGLFVHNGDNTPSSYDPLTILEEAKDGQSFRCVEYSILAAGLLWAYGIQSRTIGLKIKEVETIENGAGHVVIEFWDADQDKWIMCDVQAGVILEKSGVQLSTYEVRVALDNDESVDYILVADSRFDMTKKYDDNLMYLGWIKPYLYFIDTPAHLLFDNHDRRAEQIVMLVPEGIKPPEKFQGMFRMNALYTNSVADFYPIGIRSRGYIFHHMVWGMNQKKCCH